MIDHQTLSRSASEQKCSLFLSVSFGAGVSMRVGGGLTRGPTGEGWNEVSESAILALVENPLFPPPLHDFAQPSRKPSVTRANAFRVGLLKSITGIRERSKKYSVVAKKL